MAAPTSQPISGEQSHPDLVEPGSLPKDEEELKKEAEQRLRRDSDELEQMEGLSPSVNFTERQFQIQRMWMKEAHQFKTDYIDKEMKIHRFPASLQGLDSRYISPMAVGIGLYHHNSGNLQEMEKVKRVATHHFVTESGYSFDDIYAAVFSVIGTARSFYDAKVEVGDAEFAEMMLIDGCFLLQFMLAFTIPSRLPPWLVSCFHSNQACISSDIMLLENQLPWLVVERLIAFRSVPLEEFIRSIGRLVQIRGDMEMESVVLDVNYIPPHLLGVLYLYKAGSINSSIRVSNPDDFTTMSNSISAIELGEIGIKLTAGKTTLFADMGFKKGFFTSKIFLAPILLNDVSTCWLVNMAAFEVSMGMDTSGRKHTYQIEAVVCSYLSVLAMLMDREEDVHELRSKHLVQAECTNKETLDFFKLITRRIISGPLYIRILEEVEAYKRNRWMWIKVHRFVYKNFKAIVTVFSIIGVLVGIFKTLLSLKKQ